jgi:hypothetical protein
VIKDYIKNEWMNEEIQENRINTKKSGGTSEVSKISEEVEEHQRKIKNIRRNLEISEDRQNYQRNFRNIAKIFG